MADVRLRVRVRDDDDLAAAETVAAAIPDLEMEASTGEPKAGVAGQIEPITAILIAAGVAATAKFLADWWEHRRGGLVIDQRPDANDDIYRDPDVPWGYIIVFPRDGGAVKIETQDQPKDAVHQLLEKLIGSAFTSAADIAKSARQVVPEDKVEENFVAA
jgi:hypothetical protein